MDIIERNLVSENLKNNIPSTIRVENADVLTVCLEDGKYKATGGEKELSFDEEHKLFFKIDIGSEFTHLLED